MMRRRGNGILYGRSIRTSVFFVSFVNIVSRSVIRFIHSLAIQLAGYDSTLILRGTEEENGENKPDPIICFVYSPWDMR